MTVQTEPPVQAAQAAQAGAQPDYKTEIAALVRGNITPGMLRERILDYHENDVAAALDTLTPDERTRLYRVLSPSELADVMEYADDVGVFLNELSLRKQVAVVSELEVSTAVDALRGMSKDRRATIIDLMDDEMKREITLLSSFSEDEIGSRMTTNFISIHTGLGIRQAMRELIDQAADNDNISTIYVTNANQLLIGAIDLKDLIIAREGTALQDITMTSYPYVYAADLVEDSIERLRDYSEDSIPVLDADNRLVGVLTSQDITELVGDAMGEDYARLGGLTAEEDLNEPLVKSISKRLPWLVVLLGLGLVVSGVVGLFEKVVAGLTMIVAFQSLVLDMAGNVGTQSLAITIRVLMDETLSPGDRKRLLGKEARVGLTNGAVLGLLSFVFVGLFLMLVKGQSALFAFSVSGCIGAALLVSMMLSSVSGTLVPMAFKRLGIDPAVASGPLITTMNDLVAVVSYYGLAWLLLLGTVAPK